MEEAPTATPASEEPNEIAEKPPRNWLKTLGFTLLGLVLASGIFAAGYFTALKTQPTKVAPFPTPTPQPISQVTPIPIPTPDPTANWETYTNTAAGFSIKHPTGWRKSEASNWVGFGPQEIGEDVLLGVSFYDKSEKTTSQIKDDIGKQFPGRKQSEETITINNLTATKIVTTTNEIADWYSVILIIDSGNSLFAISNGAQTDSALNEMLLRRTGKKYDISFEQFYSTLKFLD